MVADSSPFAFLLFFVASSDLLLLLAASLIRPFRNRTFFRGNDELLNSVIFHSNYAAKRARNLIHSKCVNQPARYDDLFIFTTFNHSLGCCRN